MKKLELIPMEFVSSHGTLLVNENGSIHKDSDLDDWLGTIDKVDVEELSNYYKLNNLSEFDSGDVLDFGYWDKEGIYYPPEKSWRIEIFHNQDIQNEDEVNALVEKSFEWIKENRKL